MIMPILLMIGLLLATGCIARAEETADWYKSDVTGRLEQVIADFRINYQNVQSVPHMFVCEGVRLDVHDGKRSLRDVWFIGYSNPGEVRFDANSILDETSFPGRSRERWDQHLVYRGKLFRRWGPFSADVREDLSDEEKIAEARKSFVRLDPIDMTISLQGEIYSRGPLQNSDIALTQGVLKSATFDESKNIVQVTEFLQPNGLNVRMETVWGKESSYFPTKCLYSIVSEKSNNEIVTPLSLIVSSWRADSDVYLPTFLSLRSLRKTSTQHEMELSVAYKVGKQVPKDLDISPDVEDWREPIRNAFGVEWQRKVAHGR